MDANHARLVFFRVFALVTWVLEAIITAYTLYDTAALASANFSLLPLTATAAILDLVTLGSIILFTSAFLWSRQGDWLHFIGRKALVITGCVFVSFLSLGLTLGHLVAITINSPSSNSNIPDWWTGMLSFKYTLWGLSASSQGTLFICILWIQQRTKHDLLASAVKQQPMSSDVRISMRPTSPRDASSLFGHSNPFSSPTLSRTSSQSFESLRSSLHSMVRPHSSRSKFVKSPSSMRGAGSHLESGSVEQSPGADGFDTWDTTSVEQQFREALTPLSSMPNVVFAPSRGTALEPIPGSRPASPAKPLDGPFPELSTSASAEALQTPSITSRRPETPSMSEAHIHPLFRTDSPTPPPATTPGTIITAARQSGQAITRPLSHKTTNESLRDGLLRSDGRTVSPSPLINR